MLFDLKGYDFVCFETFDGKAYDLNIVKIGNDYYFRFEKEPHLIRSVKIKPNPEFEYVNGTVMTLTNKLARMGKNVSLVKECYIDPEDFKELTEQRVFKYSYIVSQLYGFDPERAYDYKHHTADFKRTKNKELVLTRYKNNMFQ